MFAILRYPPNAHAHSMCLMIGWVMLSDILEQSSALSICKSTYNPLFTCIRTFVRTPPPVAFTSLHPQNVCSDFYPNRLVFVLRMNECVRVCTICAFSQNTYPLFRARYARCSALWRLVRDAQHRAMRSIPSY